MYALVTNSTYYWHLLVDCSGVHSVLTHPPYICALPNLLYSITELTLHSIRLLLDLTSLQYIYNVFCHTLVGNLYYTYGTLHSLLINFGYK